MKTKSRDFERRQSRELFDYLIRRGAMQIDPRTMVELAALGYQLPANLPVLAHEVSNPDHLIVCAALTSPLILPDNQVGNCADCNARIQYRPYYGDGPTKLCSACAMRRVRPQ